MSFMPKKNIDDDSLEGSEKCGREPGRGLDRAEF